MHFELLKMGRNSKVESGINAALTVALSWKVGKLAGEPVSRNSDFRLNLCLLALLMETIC